jgi:hypothetical protein
MKLAHRTWHDVPLSRAAGTLLCAAAVGLGGCAAGPASPLQQRGDGVTPVSIQTAEGTSDHTVRHEDFVAVSTVAVPRTQAWEHLLAVWEEMELPQAVGDRRAFTLTLNEQTVVRRLGTVPLSNYLSCGRSMSGWNADTHRIRLSIRTLLERTAADSTRVHTRLDAVAHSTGGTSAAPIQCTSKGTLEMEIARRVQQRAAPGMLR